MQNEIVKLSKAFSQLNEQLFIADGIDGESILAVFFTDNGNRSGVAAFLEALEAIVEWK